MSPGIGRSIDIGSSCFYVSDKDCFTIMFPTTTSFIGWNYVLLVFQVHPACVGISCAARFLEKLRQHAEGSAAKPLGRNRRTCGSQTDYAEGWVKVGRKREKFVLAPV